jgi:hypothetical protein
MQKTLFVHSQQGLRPPRLALPDPKIASVALWRGVNAQLALLNEAAATAGEIEPFLSASGQRQNAKYITALISEARENVE